MLSKTATIRTTAATSALTFAAPFTFAVLHGCALLVVFVVVVVVVVVVVDEHLLVPMQRRTATATLTIFLAAVSAFIALYNLARVR